MTVTTHAQERRAHYAALVDRDALRAQLAALAEEHETLANHARIVEANLAALVEKVLAFITADDAICATEYSDKSIAVAGKAFAELKDLARSLKP